MNTPRARVFRDSHQDIEAARQIPQTPQTQSPAYRLAFADNDFLCRPELRPVRLQLELLKAEMAMNEAGINSTVVLFGGARIPAPVNAGSARTETLGKLSKYYDEARRFARLVTQASLADGGTENVICTGARHCGVPRRVRNAG